MDFTSLCTSPEPKLNSQVKLTPQHMGRCLGCVSVPHRSCSSGSWEKWRSGGGLLRKVVLSRALLLIIILILILIIMIIGARDSLASMLGI